MVIILPKHATGQAVITFLILPGSKSWLCEQAFSNRGYESPALKETAFAGLSLLTAVE